jgi:hypothetical protein
MKVSVQLASHVPSPRVEMSVPLGQTFPKLPIFSQKGAGTISRRKSQSQFNR